jgi:hypothetical protein
VPAGGVIGEGGTGALILLWGLEASPADRLTGTVCLA